MENKNIDNIKLRILKPIDIDKVLQFTIDHYYPDEPLASCEPKLTVVSDTEKSEIIEAIKSGTSIKAVLDTEEGEELLGINLAMPKQSGYIEEWFEAAKREGEKTKYSRILQILGSTSRKADIFNRYGVDRILYLSQSCVAPKAQGKNLTIRLIKELLALGKRLGYTVFTGHCTGYYSALVSERMGMDLVHTLLYKDFVDENNEPIFKISPPHEGIKIYA